MTVSELKATMRLRWHTRYDETGPPAGVFRYQQYVGKIPWFGRADLKTKVTTLQQWFEDYAGKGEWREIDLLEEDTSVR